MPVATLAEILGVAGAAVGILTGVIGTVIACCHTDARPWPCDRSRGRPSRGAR